MRRTAALFAALVLVAAGACTSGGVDPLPAPPTTRPRPSTTAPPDYSNVQLAAVPGRTTTTVAIAGGQATIKGIVTGPDGPVPGAVVHLERLVGDDMAALDVGTTQDGTFTIPGIFGGRYRVRAFRPPDLALVKPEVFFLGGTDTHELRLELERYTGVAVKAAVAPNPPVATERANLLVQVTFQSVDTTGVVRAVPIPGVRVELFPTGRWTIEDDSVQAADDQGRAVWQVTCERQGQQGMSVLVGDDESFELSLPACAQPPPRRTTTTTRRSTTSTSTATSSSSTTSTTQSTTSTTAD